MEEKRSAVATPEWEQPKEEGILPQKTINIIMYEFFSI